MSKTIIVLRSCIYMHGDRIAVPTTDFTPRNVQVPVMGTTDIPIEGDLTGIGSQRSTSLRSYFVGASKSCGP